MRCGPAARYFNPEASKKDLGYEPIVTPGDAWSQTMKWFKEVWAPEYKV